MTNILTIDSITIYRPKAGPDHIVVKVKKLYDPRDTESGLEVEFRAPRGSGEDYCAEFFDGVPVDVLDVNALAERYAGKVQGGRPAEQVAGPVKPDGGGHSS